MPYLIWVDAREAISYHQHNKLQDLAAQVSYMTGEQYDWALADWLDAEARSPLYITPRQKKNTSTDRSTGTSSPGRQERSGSANPNILTTQCTGATSTAGFRLHGSHPSRNRGWTVSCTLSCMHRKSLPGKVAGRGARVFGGSCNAAQLDMSRP